jgi:hypothetical protein
LPAQITAITHHPLAITGHNHSKLYAIGGQQARSMAEALLEG